MGRIGLSVMLVSAARLALARDGFDRKRAAGEWSAAGIRLC
jgi:hypothetical protein